MLLVMFLAMLIAYYSIQNTDWCSGCKAINCVQYTSGIECPEY